MKWNYYPLKKLAPSATTKTKFSANDHVWHLNLDQIESHTGNIIEKKMAPASSAGNSTYIFDTTNVLYSKLRPYLNKVVCPDEPGIATTELVHLCPHPQLLERKFLTYFLRSNHFLNFASMIVTGAKMPRVIMAKFWNYEIPLPPLTEQRQIVEILNQADQLRKLRTEADKKAKRILPALFIKMFGDPIQNFSGNKWPLKSFNSFSEVSYGLADRIDSSLTAEQGLRIITISNVNIDGSINPSVKKYSPADKKKIAKASVQKNDLLFNWRNGSKEHIGKTAIWENNWAGETLHVSFLLRIRPNIQQAAPYYLWTLLNLLRSAGFFTAQSRMQINSKFNASELSALKVPLPPREKQEKYDNQVNKLRELSKTFDIREKGIENIFSSLLHRAFTGDLTASWREAQMKELLQEMERQSSYLETMK